MKTTTITNETIFTINWAHGDRRSVKVSLNGKGDGRVLWWKINRTIHQFANPNTTWEEIMFAFHARHHWLTLICLKFRLDLNEVAAAIRSGGMLAGVRRAIALDSETAA